MAAIFLLGLAACGSTAAGRSPNATPSSIPTRQSIEASVASTDLAVGRNRFTFGLIDNDVPLSTGRPRVMFYHLRGNHSTRETATTAFFSNFAKDLNHTAANSSALALKGVFVTYPIFRFAGTWGAKISLIHDGKHIVVHPAFEVEKHSLTPSVGSPAPRSHNPTIHQMPATLLDSGRPPDDMHRLSIAAAIDEHRPLLVVFATPAFCVSRLCGPEVKVIESLEHKYKKLGVNFIHIEVYKNANPGDGYAPTFVQWHLRTEPWVFIVNREGIIVAKFEGPTPTAEIKPALRLAMH